MRYLVPAGASAWDYGQAVGLKVLGFLRRRAFFLGFCAFFLAYFVLVPAQFGENKYALVVVINSALLSLGSLGVWLTFAIGRINIAQGAFALIGGYSVAILITRYDVSFWLALPAAGLISAAVGVLIGYPFLRLRGVYFAMVSLALTKVASLAFLNGGDFTKGALGIVSIPRPGSLNIFGWEIIPDFTGRGILPVYLLVGVLLLLGFVVVWRIWVSRLGWIFRSMQQNEELARSIGINVAGYRVLAFAISCFFGGIAGGVFATFHQNIFPSTYTVNDSVFFMLYCFLGGLNHVMGPIVGAFLLTMGFEFLSAFQQYQVLIYGILMVLVILLLPNGVMSLMDVSRSVFLSRMRKD